MKGLLKKKSMDELPEDIWELFLSHKIYDPFTGKWWPETMEQVKSRHYAIVVDDKVYLKDGTPWPDECNETPSADGLRGFKTFLMASGIVLNGNIRKNRYGSTDN